LRTQRDVLVLCYHAVSATWPAALAISPAALRRQLELVLRAGYRGATFTEAVSSLPSRKTVVVTFDDAYSTVLSLARPVLDELGLPGTVFVVTDFADSGRPLEWPGIDQWRDGPHRHELLGLDWQQLRELTSAGWEVGSHTLTHPRLTTLGDDALERELRLSRIVCERELGVPCQAIAYPYGDWDDRVVAAAAAAGYSAAAIEDLGAERTLAWPRVGVYRNNSLGAFRLKISPTLGRVRRAFVGARPRPAVRSRT
jgi:peptidoglycan/xylan/chitin deacetylase (PgdA/CDA1 family)